MDDKQRRIAVGAVFILAVIMLIGSYYDSYIEITGRSRWKIIRWSFEEFISNWRTYVGLALIGFGFYLKPSLFEKIKSFLVWLKLDKIKLPFVWIKKDWTGERADALLKKKVDKGAEKQNEEREGRGGVFDKIKSIIRRKKKEEVSYKPLGTRWLGFWIFMLSLGGILWFLSFVVQMVRLMMQWSSIDLPVIDLVLILVMGAISILLIIVSVGLKWRKLWGWQLNWIIIFLVALYKAIEVLINVSPEFAESYHFSVRLGIALIIYIPFWFFPNYIYWKKRIGLFT